MPEDFKTPNASIQIPGRETVAVAQSPRRFEQADWSSFAITFLVAAIVYFFTAPPEVTLEFSGLVSTAALYGGVPHNPGYPLFTLYSSLFIKLLPVSNIAWRITAGAAVAAASASGLIALVVSSCGNLLLKNTAASTLLTQPQTNALRIVCGCVAGLGFAFSGAMWKRAVIVDIWALGILLFTSLLALLFRWFWEPRKKGFLYFGFFCSACC